MRHVPNMLSLFRLCLVPIFPIAFFSSHPYGKMIAIIIFIVAGFTDFLDGYIARRFNIVTQLGKVLDPLADKLMLMSALLTLWVNSNLPFWLIIIFVGKELFMIFAGAYLYFRKGKFAIPSNRYGKFATGILFLAIPIRILAPQNPAGLILITLALGFMLIAFFNYRTFYKEQKLIGEV